MLQMATNSTPWEPDGAIVSSEPAIAPVNSPLQHLEGNHVILVPLQESHAADLFTNLGGMQNAHLSKYLSSGPYPDVESLKQLITALQANLTTLFPFAILSPDEIHLSNQNRTPEQKETKTAVGIISLLRIEPAHRSVEIGYVLFCPTLQRTTAATETHYLLMEHAFDRLGFRRVEWKSNNLNEPSKRAALRLGFVHEGMFRKHMVVKGRSRDTAWFSVMDDEWSGPVGSALRKWLELANFDNGKQIKTLEEVRKSLVTVGE